MTCNNNCDQGRTCTCVMKDRSLFWDVMEGLVTLAVIIGIIVAFCFAVGYYWYAIGAPVEQGESLTHPNHWSLGTPC